MMESGRERKGWKRERERENERKVGEREVLSDRLTEENEECVKRVGSKEIDDERRELNGLEKMDGWRKKGNSIGMKKFEI